MILTRFELIAVAAAALGVIIDGLDASIINVAVPVLAESFGTDTSAIAWVTIVYFIMNAGLMLAFGRIADSGRIRAIYVTGFIIFGFGSLLCGMSDSLGFLIVSRIVQGIGAAMLAAIAPMICVKFLPTSKLGLSMAILMVGEAIGFGMGPAVGGLIIGISSWHWAFLINVPIAVFGALIAMRGFPKDTVTGKPDVDVPGTTIMFIAVLCGVLALELFSYPGYAPVCIGLAIAMLILLLTFITVEKKVKFPLLNLGMFRDWKFVSLICCYMLMSISFMGVFYIVPFYLTKAVGLDVMTAGLALIIPNIVTGIVAIPVGRYCDKHGKRNMALVCVSMLVITTVLYGLANPDMGWLGVLPAMITSGVMWGLVGSAIIGRAIDAAKEDDKGMASTLTNFVYYCGGSIGTALLASLLTFGAGSAGIPIGDLPVGSFLEGYYFAMACAVAISIIALFTAWVVNENKTMTA